MHPAATPHRLTTAAASGLLAAFGIFCPLSDAADYSYYWSVDWSDSVTPGTNFANGYSPTYPSGFNYDPYYQKTASGSLAVSAGIDGNGALVSSLAIPPNWPTGYPFAGGELIYPLYFKDSVFDLTQPGSSLRITAFAAQTGTYLGGKMFVGIESFNPTHTSDVPISIGIDFGPGDSTFASSAPFVWGDGTGALSGGSEANTVLRDTDWVRLDVSVRYEAATQELVYTLHPWEVYDAAGTLIDSDLLPTQWSGVEYRQYTSFGTSQLQNLRAVLTGTATYGPDAFTQYSFPVWDSISLQYVVVVPEAGTCHLIVAAVCVGLFPRRRRSCARGGS